MVRNDIGSKNNFRPSSLSHSIAGINQPVPYWFREYGSGSLWRNLIPSVRLASDSRVGGHYIRGEAANKCAFPSFISSFLGYIPTMVLHKIIGRE